MPGVRQVLEDFRNVFYHTSLLMLFFVYVQSSSSSQLLASPEAAERLAVN